MRSAHSHPTTLEEALAALEDASRRYNRIGSVWQRYYESNKDAICTLRRRATRAFVSGFPMQFLTPLPAIKRSFAATAFLEFGTVLGLCNAALTPRANCCTSIDVKDQIVRVGDQDSKGSITAPLQKRFLNPNSHPCSKQARYYMYMRG